MFILNYMGIGTLWIAIIFFAVGVFLCPVLGQVVSLMTLLFLQDYVEKFKDNEYAIIPIIALFIILQTYIQVKIL